MTPLRLLLAVALGLLGVPLAAAQPAAQIPRVGFLAASGPSPAVEAFRRSLRDLGYFEDRTVAIHPKWAEGRLERLPELAAELVSLNVDIVVAVGTPAALAAKNAVGATPIVLVGVADPVGADLVESLARPGRTVTGLTALADDTIGQSLGRLAEMVPRLSRVAVLSNPASPGLHAQAVREAETAAATLGLQAHVHPVRTPGELDRAFAAITRQQAGALLVLPDPLFDLHRQRILDLVAKRRLPALYGTRDWVDAGGLASYGASGAELCRRAAAYLDRIVKGAAPADLPMEPPTQFELIVNLKTAKAIGLKIPPPALRRADEVLE